MKQSLLRLAAVCALLAFGSLLAVAQNSAGRIVGTVAGPDGAIPGATITVVDNQTKKERTAVSSGEGAFVIPQLDAGTYTVTVTAQGFKTFTASDVKVDAGREYPLTASLEVGGVTENVTVVAGAETVNASNGELNNTVSPTQIQELPLDGRNPLALIPLQAGTARATGGSVTYVNGQRTSFTNITRDGINVNDNFIRANATDFSPERATSDDTGEFNVTTQNAGADQGYGAAQVQLVTPRGTSQYHGALFEYNRNSHFAANTFTNNSAGRGANGLELIPRSFLNRNQFGGKVGGPVPLTRKKGFFFFAYEHQFLRTSQTNTGTVLTAAARAGNFQFVDATGVTRTVNLFGVAPTNGTGPTGISSIVQSRILSGLPLPNTPGGNLVQGLYSFNAGFNDDYNYYTSRGDFDVNSRNTISGVYTFKKEQLQRPDVTLDFFTTAPPVNQPGINKFLSLAWTSTLSNSVTNDVRGGFSFPVANFDRFVDIPAAFLDSPLINEPEPRFLDQGRTQHNYNLQDNATYTRGNHSFRFGVTSQYFRITPFNDAGIVPTFTLNTSANSPQFTAAILAGAAGIPAANISAANVTRANSLYALLGGIVSAGTQTFNPTDPSSALTPVSLVQQYSYNNYAGYAQDQWRVRPSFTLNLGLRYEVYTPLRLLNGIALEPIIPAGSNLRNAVLDPNGGYQVIGGNAGCRYCFFREDKNNFSPVLSFAYSPQFGKGVLGSLLGENKTVIRGGFRISYVPDQFLTAARNANTGNAGLGSTANSAVVGGTSILNARVDALPSITAPPSFTLPRTFAQNNSATFNNFGTVFAVDPNVQTGRQQEISFGIQRELGFKSAVEVRYVGAWSRNLLRGVDLNQVQITNNGFLADFQRAQANLALTGNAFCTTTGCQALTIFGQNSTSPLRVNTTGGISLAAFVNNLTAGTPGDLALSILQANADLNTNLPAGQQQFPLIANPNTGAVDVLLNGARNYYNALQAEYRRRFTQGLSFQANYTFSKDLTDAVGTAQALFDPLVDNARPELEYSRADFDQTHSFNFNTVYELPFGKGKRFLNEGGAMDKVFGGFQITTILRYGSGRPITITDARGTFNRAARSTRQTANSPLTKDQIKALFGDFTLNGVRYFINPDALNITGTGSNVTSTPKSTVFSAVPAGQTGNLERAIVNGPHNFNMDLGITKRVRFTENMALELRGEAFNLTNRNNFLLPLQIDINSATFGQLTPALSTQAGGFEAPRRLQFAARFEF